MSLSDSKVSVLYEFYSENGFDQPTEKIVEILHICHKTFFNRYGNKANSIEIAWNYWQKLCKKRWATLMEHCNHSVEELTMTLYNMHEIRFKEPHYYEYTRETHRYLEPDSFFYSAIREVLEHGQQCFHIQEELKLEMYIPFLLNNLFLIDVEVDMRPDVLRYILMPALTDRGMELFFETPFA